MASDHKKARQAVLRVLLKAYRIVPGQLQWFDLDDYVARLATKYPNTDMGILITELVGEEKVLMIEVPAEPDKPLPAGARGVARFRLNPEKVTIVEDEVGLEPWKLGLIAGLFVFWLILAIYVAAKTSYSTQALELPKGISYTSGVLLWALSCRIVLGQEDWRLFLRIIRDIIGFWH
jgi:hypothetical protein